MKKWLKTLLAASLVATLSLGLAGCSSDDSGGDTGGDTASTDPIVIRISSTANATEFEGEGTTSAGVTVNYFVKEIEARTNGRITAQVFSGGQLSSTTEEFIGGLQNGAFDIGILNSGSWASYTTAYAGLNVPYLYPDFETGWAVLDSEVGQSWHAKAQEDTGTIPLCYIDIGFRQLTNSIRPVDDPSDLEGIKLRVMPDPIQTATWEALGAMVQPVDFSELYSALQQNLVDGQENPVSNIVAQKFYDLQPYMTNTNHNFTVTIPAASPVFWNKLSAEDQQLVKDIMIEAQNAGRAKTVEFADEFVQVIKDAGVEIIDLTDAQLAEFQALVTPVWEEIKETMGDEAYNALIDFVANYQG